jgi:hypothetical protein
MLFSADIAETIVATAIPRITDQFHSLDQIGWYGSAFFLTLASFQSSWGKKYKFFPIKVTFMVAIAIFELGSLICGEYRSCGFLRKILMPSNSCFSEQQHAHCRQSHRGPWGCRNRNWMLHHCCVCSASSTATRVYGDNGSNIRGWQCRRSSFGWCFHGACLLAMVVSVY